MFLFAMLSIDSPQPHEFVSPIPPSFSSCRGLYVSSTNPRLWVRSSQISSLAQLFVR